MRANSVFVSLAVFTAAAAFASCATAAPTYPSAAGAYASTQGSRVFGAGAAPPSATTGTGPQEFMRTDAGPVPTQVATSHTQHTFEFVGENQT